MKITTLLVLLYVVLALASSKIYKKRVQVLAAGGGDGDDVVDTTVVDAALASIDQTQITSSTVPTDVARIETLEDNLNPANSLLELKSKVGSAHTVTVKWPPGFMALDYSDFKGDQAQFKASVFYLDFPSATWETYIAKGTQIVQVIEANTGECDGTAFIADAKAFFAGVTLNKPKETALLRAQTYVHLARLFAIVELVGEREIIAAIYHDVGPGNAKMVWTKQEDHIFNKGILFPDLYPKVTIKSNKVKWFNQYRAYNAEVGKEYFFNTQGHGKNKYLINAFINMAKANEISKGDALELAPSIFDSYALSCFDSVAYWSYRMKNAACPAYYTNAETDGEAIKNLFLDFVAKMKSLSTTLIGSFY